MVEHANEHDRAVAVVGVAAILPDAPSVGAFWQNVTSGKDSIIEVPPDRWLPAEHYDPDPAVPDKTYCRIGAFVRGFTFDHTKFRIPAPVASAMDLAQQWMLVCAREALLDAGHPDDKVDPERIGVIVANALGGEMHENTTTRLIGGAMVARALREAPELMALPPDVRAALSASVLRRYLASFPTITADSMPGELGNVIAGRVTNALDLRGPNFTTDAACASSLAALDTAMSVLTDGRADMVVTGGVDRTMSPSTFVKFAKIGALSPDGSRPFDADANGFVMGEGCVALVLQRLADAERAGRKIYAVVRSVGASSDGRGKGITAPNPRGQVLAVRRCYELAGVSPGTVGLVEAHGTSTRVGDVAETDSLVGVFGEAGLPPRSIAMGSVKSQIGHLKSAAGAAGLLKAVLAVHHQVLPPTINVRNPNPNIAWDRLPFYPNVAARPWERRPDAPRRAAVSAFGFGGTNFHVLVEEHVPGLLTSGRRSTVSVPGAVTKSPEGVLCLGAADARALAARLAEVAANPGRFVGAGASAADLGAKERVGLAFGSAEELATKAGDAAAAVAGADPRMWKLLRARGVHRGTGPRPPVAFLFPGQGSQSVGMLRALRDSEPEVREAFDEADAAMADLLPARLSSYVFTEPSEQSDAALRDTRVCQPAMLAADVGLLRLLARYGVTPDLVMGHSLGEYAALVAAGAMRFDAAVRAVSARAKEMTSVSIADNGRMASVFAAQDVVERVLASAGGYVVTANFNSRTQTVIGGATNAVEAAVARFAADGIKAVLLPVSHAFHTEIVAPASEPLRRVLAGLGLEAPKLPIVSNVTAEPYPDAPGAHEARLDLLASQISSPVQFTRGLETLYRLGARVFVEVGPRRVLASFVDDALGERGDVVSLCTNQPKVGDRESFAQALAGLYAAGCGRPAGAGEETMPTEIRTQVAPRVAAVAPVAPAPMTPVPARGPAAPASEATQLALGRALTQFLEESWRLYRGDAPAPAATAAAPAPRDGSVVVTGVALGLPGRNRDVFAEDNLDAILRGESFIEPLPDTVRDHMAHMHVTRLVKGQDGSARMELISDAGEVLKLAGQAGRLDLASDFGIDRERLEAFDTTTQLAVGAAIMALRDAGIPLVRRYKPTSRGTFLPDRWVLPDALADETGVVFASAFPGVESLLGEVERYHEDLALRARIGDLRTLRTRLGDGAASAIDAQLEELEAELARKAFAFDRRFLFRVLAMGHSQLAELIGARGPNVQVNAACASAGLAMSVGEDWIRSGRCRRVLVLSADNAGSGRLFDWVGAGFLASGAATTEGDLTLAALPFDQRRNGMIVGMGASGLVLESEDAVRERGMRGIAEVLATEPCNSAFHGTRLDTEHIAATMERLVERVEQRHGIPRAELAARGVFVSHETYTPARGGSAAAEIHSLRRAFGPHASRMVIANTKGMTGHAMAAGIEEAVAVKMLETGLVPPVPNLREPDPELGDLALSKGGRHELDYALRFAAGFGSQLALTVLRRVRAPRKADEAAYQGWVSAVSGRPGARLEVAEKSLRVHDDGPPAVQPARSSWVPGTGPTLRAEVDSPHARVVRAPVAAPVAASHAATPPAAAPVAAAVAAAAPVAPRTSPVVDKVMEIVSKKAGYPRDMLALDLDLEADLGIDTVKQAEIFSEIRATFELPRRDDLKLREYPTLGHLARLITELRPELGATVAAPIPVATAGAPAAAAPTAPSAPASSPLVDRVVDIVASKAGYPRDMLALDLDLEADLGIDTVKQAEIFAEVRTAFGLPRREDLKLREYPTLGHIVRLITELRPELTASATAPAAAPTASAPATTPDAAAPASSPLVDQVVDIVARKAGYPRDMLALDLDLEADLGIDTVKQAEIFAEVRTTFELPRREDLKLREYPTLGHIVRLIGELRPELSEAAAAAPAVVAPPAPAPAPATPAAAAVTPVDPAAAPLAPPTPGGVVRRVPVPVLRPDLSLCVPTRAALAGGARVVLVRDAGGVAPALQARLEQRGVEVLVAEGLEVERDAAAWLAAGPVTGIYDLAALDPEPDLTTAAADEVQQALARRVGRLSRLARALYAELRQPGAFVVSATRLGGMHGYGPTPPRAPMGGAVTGLVKALSRELADAVCKAVDFEDDAPAAAVAEALVAETERDPAVVEVGHAFGARHTLMVAEAQRAAGDGVKLSPQSVVLVTGAAGGITAAIAADLGGRSGGTFHLTDIVPPPGDDPDVQRVGVDRDGLKRDLFERAKAAGERITPAQLEGRLAQLERQKSVSDAMRAITAAGGTARYHQADVRDAAALGAVVEGIRATHGRIDVVLHAAGLERSRFLGDKPAAEFDRVFEVKALGLAGLLAATADVPLQAIVCFSSVAGRFGNAGQTDYSAANDLLCKTMLWLAGKRPGVRALAIDWTAWGDVGMATRGSIPEMMRRAGIDMLPLAEGLPVVGDELAAGTRGEIVVGKALGLLTAPRDATGGIDLALLGARVGSEQLAMLGRVVSMHVQEGLRIETALDPLTEPFLKDHAIDGVPVLPGVMGLEGFVEVARLLLPGHRAVGLEDVRFEAPFKFHRGERRHGIFRAQLRAEGPTEVLADVTLSSTHELPNGELREKRHFSGTVRLERSGKPAEAKSNGAHTSGARRGVVAADDVYRVFFHGPSYRVIGEVEATERGARGRLRAALPPALLAKRTTLFSPRVLELCLQTAGVYELGTSGKMALPAAIERVVTHAVPREDAELTVEVEPRGDAGALTFDARVVDTAGRVYLEVTGYRTSALPASPADTLLAPMRKAFARERA